MNELDKQAIIFNNGFKAGQEHSQPSLDTRKFMDEATKIMSALQTEMSNIEEKLKDIPSRAEMKLVVREAIDETLKCADKKYATQDRVSLLEKVVYGFVGMVLTAVGGAIIYNVLK